MKTCSILLLALLWFTCANVWGQVTIGVGLEPEKGTLLDLKQEQKTNGTENSKKGMVLPRVQLTDMNKLYPMYTSGYNLNEDKNHVGLMVYNIVAKAPFCRGVYVWTGTEWRRLGPCGS